MEGSERLRLTMRPEVKDLVDNDRLTYLGNLGVAKVHASPSGTNPWILTNWRPISYARSSKNATGADVPQILSRVEKAPYSSKDEVDDLDYRFEQA